MLVNSLGLVSLSEFVTSLRVIFRSLGGLKNCFEEKILENVQCILILKLYPDFVVMFFIFNSFKTTWLIPLVNCLNSKSVGGQLEVSNSGGIMLVCKWASVNDVVQNKFWSTIHVLSQLLLAQSHWWKH